MRTYCSGMTPFGAIRPRLQDNTDEEAHKKPQSDGRPAKCSVNRRRNVKDHKERSLTSIYLYLILFFLFVFLFWNCGVKKEKKHTHKWTHP